MDRFALLLIKRRRVLTHILLLVGLILREQSPEGPLYFLADKVILSYVALLIVLRFGKARKTALLGIPDGFAKLT